MFSMVLQCFLSAAADGRPSAGFFLVQSSAAANQEQGWQKRGGGAVRTHRVRYRVSARLDVDSPDTVTLSGVCPEGEPCSYLARPSLLHHYPGRWPARWLRAQATASTGKSTVPKRLASAPKDSTLRKGSPTHPRSCRHILVQFVRASPLFKLPRGASPVYASVPAASHHLRSWSERWSWARARASTGKPIVQE